MKTADVLGFVRGRKPIHKVSEVCYLEFPVFPSCSYKENTQVSGWGLPTWELEQLFSTGVVLLLGEHLATYGDLFWLSHQHPGREVRDAAKGPSMHGAATHCKELPSPKGQVCQDSPEHRESTSCWYCPKRLNEHVFFQINTVAISEMGEHL